jgi:hypothetical protein
MDECNESIHAAKVLFSLEGSDDEKFDRTTRED